MRVSTIMSRTSMILLILVICSFWLVSDIFAKYTTANGKSDIADVASFYVTAVPEKDLDIELDFEKETISQEYIIAVTSHSEVDVKYDISIQLKEETPEGVSFLINEKEPTSISGDKKTLTFSNVGELQINSDTTENVTLTVNVDKNLFIEFIKNLTTDEIPETTNFTVNVHFEQVD